MLGITSHLIQIMLFKTNKSIRHQYEFHLFGKNFWDQNWNLTLKSFFSDLVIYITRKQRNQKNIFY